MTSRMAPGAAVDLSRAIREKALRLGFDRAAFCEARLPEEAHHFDRWLQAGMHGSMEWMAGSRDRRLDPAKLLEGARSMVVVALAHGARADGGAAPSTRDGIVARYARSDDYHRVMGDRLQELQDFIEASATGHRALAYVDTGALLERLWASRAGLGWIGKNALVLNERLGSYFLIGVVVTTLALPPDPPAADRCGSCTLCIDACPTAAIVEPRLVDSRRCVSYHTIEMRGGVPEEFRESIGLKVFGCDECQEACPWNGPLPTLEASALAARPEWTTLSPFDLLAMSHAEYLQRFRGSAIKRATYQGLRRNAAVALGNAGEAGAAALALLDRIGSDPAEDPIVKEHALWAAGRLRSSSRHS
jgi:epoxyqueuosine reductase